MSLFQQLNLKQTTSLVMTPQLRLAIKLLQLSNQELSTLVAQEMEQNPFLSEPDSIDGLETEKHEDAHDLDFSKDDSFQEDLDATDSWADQATSVAKGPDEELSFESILATQVTLRDHLLEQFNADVSDPRKRLIGAFLIDSLTPAGYLEEPLEAIAQALGAHESEIEKVLYRLQKCDPVGIGARSLSECLKLQLAQMDELTEDVERLLDHIELLGKGDLKRVCKECSLQIEVLQEILTLIKTLNPKPGALFEKTQAQTRIPDIIVRRFPSDNGWRVDLNTETLPKVLVDRPYYSTLKNQAGKKQEKQYITQQLNAANWLVKAMDQRAQTILKVATELVTQQEAFFLHGIEHLKPLILRDIAEATELHESTISRVTTNKYMATPRGVFELKYFFTTSLGSTDGGDAHSSELVRHKIKSLIGNEPAHKPLSDDKLVKLLKTDGIEVARRTITKYREAMKIPSSYERKRLKSL